MRRAGFEVRKAWGRVRREWKELRMEARRVARLEAFSIIALGGHVSEGFLEEVESEDRTGEWRLLYRSMMVIRGETSPEAHAAAVMSDMTRHGKFFVFQS